MLAVGSVFLDPSLRPAYVDVLISISPRMYRTCSSTFRTSYVRVEHVQDPNPSPAAIVQAPRFVSYNAVILSLTV